ncbi:MAG: PCYCGC motif-containing (lipo)protein [Chloroflexota bacterium]
MRLLRQPALVLLLLAGALVLAACGGSAQNATSVAALPDWARSAPPRVREAYQYAVANPEELKKYPCYCGCGAMGHTSNLSCYIQDIAPDGAITFDTHAMGCGICVDITQDVMRLKAEGKTSLAVRTYVDAQYSPFGPPTDTPLPAE